MKHTINRGIFRNKKYACFFLFIALLGLYQCKTSGLLQQSVIPPADMNSSPVVSPEQSIKKMRVEDGFEVKLVASEPLISTPVALTFDTDNRLWVVEMNGYMPDTTGVGEDTPSGKIVILEDKNNDGVMDDRKVFLDSLVMPRAICLIENGVLVAEPPNLWYYEIADDKPVKKVLVDKKYAEDGNVEHYPNGLLRGLDNWIYNAKSPKRYRKSGDSWLIDSTLVRGQWGITQDNYGRLYYNNNTNNLFGDYFTPALARTNKNQRNAAGYTEKIVPDNRVYPSRPNPGVNRGYMNGILNDSLYLVNFTAACGPVIYRGDLFGKAYHFNAFVAEPAANLIKRNMLSEDGYVTRGKQAYEGKEFLTSVDERFRPVNLYNGPDGALYVADMYRGILEHITYLTPYLKDQIKRRKLSGALACGRIYKIVPVKTKAKPVQMPVAADKLVGLLGHPNGWVRDKAQQLIVDGKMSQAIPLLRAALKETSGTLKVIHAMWALEGIGALRAEDISGLLNQPSWPVRLQALNALPSVMNKDSYKSFVTALKHMLAKNDDLAAPYIAFLVHHIQPFDQEAAAGLLEDVIRKYPNDTYVTDAVISSVQGSENMYQNRFLKILPDTGLVIHKRLHQVITEIAANRRNRDPELLAKEFPKGAAIFSSTCQTCHGADGKGVTGLAPPLNRSEWVTGDKGRLASVVLFGLTGPIRVNNHVYKAPEINGEMPGIAYNNEFSDEDIAQVLSFIRRSWQNNGNKVTPEEVAAARKRFSGRQKVFTADELSRLFQ